MAGNSKEDSRALLLMGLLALWLAAYGYSVVVLVTTQPVPAATIPEAKRMVGFLGWQGVAGMVAFACWGVGWSFPRGSGIRRVAAVPIVMALALVLVMAGLAVFGN